MKRVLVTGGAGFIGTNLCINLLTNTNYHIICVDNLSSGKLDNIQSLKKHKNFEFINHDITQYIDLDVDEIYHLASPESSPHNPSEPINKIKTNLIGTLNILELARTNKAKVLLASTSRIYQDHASILKTACYDEGKRIAETLMLEYNQKYNVQTRIARIFDTYGPHMNPKHGNTISKLITQALNKQKLSVYGDGQQTHSFCYVTDTVEGLIKLMQSDYTIPINIGNPKPYKTIEIAQLILEKNHLDLNHLEHHQLPETNSNITSPDITRTKILLNWKPKVTLDGDGLETTIEYFKESLGYSSPIDFMNYTYM